MAYIKTNIIVDAPPLIFTGEKPPKSRQYSKIQVVEQEGQGLGVQAKANIARRKAICEYAGELILESTARERTVQSYMMECTLELPFFPSATYPMRIDASKHRSLGAMVCDGREARGILTIFYLLDQSFL